MEGYRDDDWDDRTPASSSPLLAFFHKRKEANSSKTTTSSRLQESEPGNWIQSIENAVAAGLEQLRRECEKDNPDRKRIETLSESVCFLADLLINLAESNG